MPDLVPGAERRDLTHLTGRIGAAFDALRGRPTLPFSPGKPVEPIAQDAEQQMGPRAFQYPVAVNTVIVPRSEYYGSDMVSFDQLRRLARLYNVARLCINVRIEEIQRLDWGVVARDPKQADALRDTCTRVEAFWQSPDRMNDFNDWIGTLLRDLFEVDAWSMFPERTYGGQLHSLVPIDGTTVKPLLNGRGQVAGYQQVLWGAPRSQYLRGSADEPDESLPAYWLNATTRRHQLYYWPYWTAVDSPYGSPPIEGLILTVNTALRKQNKDMRHFTDGNIPAGLATPPEGLMNVEQLRAFEEAFNADLAGNDAARERIKFLPWPMDYTPFAPFQYNTTIDEWMLKLTCAMFGVTPSQIGFTNDVNRATAGAQADVQTQRGGALARWLERRLSQITAHELGAPEVEFKFMIGGREDKQAAAQTDKIYLDAGVVTTEEVRAERFPNLPGKAPGKPAAPPTAATTTGQPVQKRKRKRIRGDNLPLTEDVLTRATKLYREVSQ